MKNIHILPTDKPSRLYKHKFSEIFRLLKNELQVSGQTISQNIYITSDEEIKEGDWYLDTSVFKENISIGIGIYQMKYSKWGIEGQGDCKKIILTTDQDLIKDGVQAIPDDFLEWFVKNPSCEWVEINFSLVSGGFKYIIIIPKEEPKYPIGGYAPGYYMCNCSTCKKQFQGDKRAVQCEPCAIEMIKEEPKQELSTRLKNSLIQFNINLDEAFDLPDWKLKTIGFSNRSILELKTLKEEPKQETLEEAARKYLKNCKEAIHDNIMFIQGSNFGAKWQAQRMYSEEDMIESSKYGYNFHKTTQFPNQEFEDSCIRNTQQWLTKFKKK